jgi:NagD protein
VCAVDGVLYHQNKLVPGADKFVQWLQENEKKFLFLTNSSDRSPRELSEKLKRMGIKVGEEHFYTSALATAAFLAKNVPPEKEGSAYVIGDPGLTSALYDVGISMNDVDPDFVVVGETKNYNFEKLEHAVHLVRAGARLIGTNQDVRDRKGQSFVPACGALIKPIELAAGATAYFVGKVSDFLFQ